MNAALLPPYRPVMNATMVSQYDHRTLCSVVAMEAAAGHYGCKVTARFMVDDEFLAAASCFPYVTDSLRAAIDRFAASARTIGGPE